jgi:carbon monoxide dehydrogenase subunit G
MRIDQTVEVPAPITKVWALLGDIPSVAGCMPGATLTKTVDETTYEGLVKVGIGPLTMNYTGTVTIEERDEAAHTVRLLAAGRDRRGSGTAKAHITARLLPAGEGTKLRVDSDVSLTGRVAALGRGVNDVAERLFAEFADRLTTELSGTPTEPSGTPTEPSGTPAQGSSTASGAPAAPPSPARTAPKADGIRLGALVWSVTRQRLGAFLIRLGEKVQS